MYIYTTTHSDIYICSYKLMILLNFAKIHMRSHTHALSIQLSVAATANGFAINRPA